MVKKSLHKEEPLNYLYTIEEKKTDLLIFLRSLACIYYYSFSHSYIRDGWEEDKDKKDAHDSHRNEVGVEEEEVVVVVVPHNLKFYKNLVSYILLHYITRLFFRRDLGQELVHIYICHFFSIWEH